MAVQEEQPNKIIKTSNYYSTTQTSKSFPTEIILEILLRLSVASLFRCKSVCKLWLSLISDPHFVKSHLKLSDTNNNDYAHYQLASSSLPVISLKTCPLNDVLFARSDVNVLDHGYPLRRRSNQRDLSIVGSWNGLLCIVVDKVTPFICNPSTRIWNQVPYCGFEQRSHVENMLYGFAYDKLTDDYKVFGISRVLRYRGNGGYKYVTTAKIYSLKTRKWKDIAGIPRGDQLSDQHGKFLNGAIHWAAEGKSSGRWVIVSLDLAKETYGQVSQPVYDDGDHKDLTLGVLGEWLCVLCNYGVSHADVWVMKVYGVKDSWTKLVSIPYLTKPCNRWSRFSVPLFVSIDGKFLLQLGPSLVVYDSNNNSSSEIENFDECLEACTFVESLVSPNAVAA